MTGLVSKYALCKVLICLPSHSKQFWWIAQLTFPLLKQLIAKIQDMTGTKY